MRLKEIKQGMAIMCHNFEQGEAAVKQLNRQGAGLGHYSPHYTDEHCVVYLNFDNQYSFWNRYNATCDFSDLVLPELTAEEALQIASEFCKNKSHCADCPILGNCYRDCDSDKGKVVEVLCKWKSDHEKKEPEIETVDICRIIEIQPDGRKRCVHEEDISDGELMYSGDAVEKCRYILKNYCMEHDGEFIAVHEVVSRVRR